MWALLSIRLKHLGNGKEARKMGRLEEAQGVPVRTLVGFRV